MSPAARSWTRSPLLGLLGGALVALVGALWLIRASAPNDRAARLHDPPLRPLEIRVNALPRTIAPLPSLPLQGWTLEIRVAPDAPAIDSGSLRVELRQGESVTPLPEESFRHFRDGLSTTIGPTAIALEPGPLAIRASAHDARGRPLRDEIEVELRPWISSSPIGTDQILHFDFEIDRDRDGAPDFPKDLEAFGLASPGHPRLAHRVAGRIASRALERARRAYDGTANQGPFAPPAADVAAIELRLNATHGPSVTRICVGGRDPSGGDTVGNVRFDPNNADRCSTECAILPPTGLFPFELETYRADETFRAAFGPLMETGGGVGVGEHPLDELIFSDGFEFARASLTARERASTIDHAIEIFADVLGTIMAHEAAHALGLVPPGPPDEGLFGGKEGPAYAHNKAVEGDAVSGPWIMDPGTRLSFTDLAGLGEIGELRFRPLNRAYLRDRIVLARPAPSNIPASEAKADRGPDRYEDGPLRDPRRNPCS